MLSFADHGGNLGHSRRCVRAVNDHWVDRSVYRLFDVFSGVFGGKIDGAGAVEWQPDPGLVRSYEAIFPVFAGLRRDLAGTWDLLAKLRTESRDETEPASSVTTGA